MASHEEIMESFEAMVRALDWEAIETWRQHVTLAHVESLVALYARMQTWEERCAVLQLLQDKPHPEVTSVMHHFLVGAPKGDDENFELTKATALCHLTGNFELFPIYYDDREKLAADIAAWRAKRPN